jgi:hypothetical protein
MEEISGTIERSEDDVKKCGDAGDYLDIDNLRDL